MNTDFLVMADVWELGIPRSSFVSSFSSSSASLETFRINGNVFRRLLDSSKCWRACLLANDQYAYVPWGHLIPGFLS